VFALFVRDDTIWEFLYSDPQGTGDNWGRRALQIMLGAIPDENGQPFWDGPTDGVWSQKWSDAIRHFQQQHQPESITGSAGDAEHRKPIFVAYMDFICVGPDGKPYTLSKTDDFLARGRGQGPDKKPNGHGDFQGCGKYNPALIGKGETFPSEQARREANRPNRRVVVYMFKPGNEIDPNAKNGWPCPAFKEPGGSATAKCQARLWKDGEQRRTRPSDEKETGPDGKEKGKRRLFRDQEDTFACRFYQGFAARSVCEGIIHLWQIRLATRDKDGQLQPLPNMKVVAQLGAESDAALIRTATLDDGRLHLPVLDDKTTMILRVDSFGLGKGTPDDGTAPSDPDSGDPESEKGEAHYFPLTLDGGALIDLPADSNNDDAVKQRLHNLGYGPGQLSAWTDDDLKHAVQRFRKTHGLKAGDSADDDEFRDQLRKEYGDEDAPLVPPEDG
jgi:hypothetical protein